VLPSAVETIMDEPELYTTRSAQSTKHIFFGDGECAQV
jgi:hypothetical protein